MTPLPQAGNPRPRCSGSTPTRRVINRLGFNSEGEAVVLASGSPRAPTAAASSGSISAPTRIRAIAPPTMSG